MCLLKVDSGIVFPELFILLLIADPDLFIDFREDVETTLDFADLSYFFAELDDAIASVTRFLSSSDSTSVFSSAKMLKNKKLFLSFFCFLCEK